MVGPVDEFRALLEVDARGERPSFKKEVCGDFRLPCDGDGVGTLCFRFICAEPDAMMKVPIQPSQPTLTIRPFSIMLTPHQSPSATPGERGERG